MPAPRGCARPDPRCGRRCPASTSSKTSVGVSSASARTCLIARATRDISPPDAILRQRSGRFAGIRGEDEHDEIRTGRIERDRVAIEFDRGFVRAGRAATERHVEDAGRGTRVRPARSRPQRPAPWPSRPGPPTAPRQPSPRRRGAGHRPRRVVRVRPPDRGVVRPRAAARSPWAMTAASSSP